MRKVHVVAWLSDGTGGFDWYHNAEAANSAYETEKANSDKYADAHWKAFRFDFETDIVSDTEMTKAIDQQLDELCFSAPLAYMPGFERGKVKVVLHHHGRTEFL